MVGFCGAEDGQIRGRNGDRSFDGGELGPGDSPARGGTDGSESFRRPWGDGSKDQNGPKVAGRRAPVLMAWRFATPGVGTCNLL